MLYQCLSVQHRDATQQILLEARCQYHGLRKATAAARDLPAFFSEWQFDTIDALMSS